MSRGRSHFLLRKPNNLRNRSRGDKIEESKDESDQEDAEDLKSEIVALKLGLQSNEASLKEHDKNREMLRRLFDQGVIDADSNLKE